MGKITALRAAQGRGKRLKIFLDGKFAFSLGVEVVANEGLQIGQELSAEEAKALADADSFNRCLAAALRYLSYRPRSEFEIRERLWRRGFDDQSVGAVIARLKEQGLIDDTAFAQFWKDNRESFNPRSRRLTRLELRQRGVASEVIDEAIGAISDNDSAYRAALGKSAGLPRSDYKSFCCRLGGYLKRRGFDYEVISRTVKRIWQETGEQPEDSSEIRLATANLPLPDEQTGKG